MFDMPHMECYNETQRRTIVGASFPLLIINDGNAENVEATQSGQNYKNPIAS